MITVKQIEAFYWAGSLGSFEAAAEKLNTAQSTISKRIKELEYQSKVVLFDRSTRSVSLTMKGRELLQYAEDFLKSSSDITRALGTGEAYTGRFCIGVTELIAVTWLPKVLSSIKQKYPNLTLEFEVDMAMKLFDRMSNSRLDLVIAPDIEIHSEFESFPLPELALSWMCSPKFDIPELIPVSELTKYPLLAQPATSAMQYMIRYHLPEQDRATSQIITCNSMIGLAELTAAGFGVTCLPSQYFAQHVKSGTLRTFETEPKLRSLKYSVFYRKGGVPICLDIANMAAELCDYSHPHGY